MVELISCLTTVGREAPSAAITASLVVDVDAVFATLGVALRSLARLLIGDHGAHFGFGGGPRMGAARSGAILSDSGGVVSLPPLRPGDAKETRGRPEAAHRRRQRRHSPRIRVDNASDGAGDRGRRAHPGGAQHRYFLWGDRPRRRCRKCDAATRGARETRARPEAALWGRRAAPPFSSTRVEGSQRGAGGCCAAHEGATARGAARSAAFQLAF
ncbi:hypothetical protein BD626DRAFT_635180 [Schizophyllum amplum]|uniref:Uncharacterized protein n=1 Tax=Schizophyllum amplum TaxID=97359 RepID=A0A550BWP3_9AGAR|nr:hypothetical protein BD626DRAFT_635180 [Auriculariopsis ampla]